MVNMIVMDSAKTNMEESLKIKDFPVFSTLCAEEISFLESVSIRKDFEKKQVILWEGEPCKGIYLLRSGRVKIFKTSPEGKEQIFGVVKKGETFNEVPVFDGALNPASASSITETSIYIIRNEHLLKVLEKHPEICLKFLNYFAGRIRHFSSLVEDMAFKDVPVRLAKILLKFIEEEGSSDGKNKILKRNVTLQEMAAMVGTVREVVTRALRKMEGQEILKVDRHQIIITNLNKLKNISNSR